MKARNLKTALLLFLLIIAFSSASAQAPQDTTAVPANVIPDSLGVNLEAPMTIPDTIGTTWERIPTAPDTIGSAWEEDTPYLEYLNAEDADDGPWTLTISKVFLALLVFFIAYVLLKFVTRILETVAERNPTWRLTVKALIPVIRITSWTVIIYIIVAHIFAPPIQTLVALTASAGIAIGFASQDILKNIFGGIMILFDRPFQVGDKIEVGSHYGEVISIGLRTVRLMTAGNNVVSVPNTEVVNQSVINANMGEQYCQVDVAFFLPPDIDFYQVRNVARLAAATSRYVMLSKPIKTSVLNVVLEARSMVKIKVLAFVYDHRNEFAFRTEVTERVIEELLRRRLVSPSDLTMTSK